MDVIPLDAKLVKGAHGRIPESDLDKPIFVSSKSVGGNIAATGVFEGILKVIKKQDD
jgi:hypothetical protein